MKAVVWSGGWLVEVLDVPAPDPRADWVVVNSAYTGICGSDLHVCRGELARVQPGIVIGHEFVGTLAEPTGDLPAGTRVFVNPVLSCGKCRACRLGFGHVCANFGILGIDAPGGAAAQVSVPAGSVVPIPDELDLLPAALIEPTAVAVHMTRRAEVGIGQRVTVCGAGPVGVLLALCAEIAGAEAVVVEPSEVRREAAHRLGLTAVSPDEAKDLRQADVVFDAAGHPSAAATLAALTLTRGTIVVAGIYAEPPAFDLLDLTFREITVRGSRVYTDPDVRTAIELLAQKKIDALGLISEVIAIDDAPSAITRLEAASSMKIVIDLQQAAE